MFGTNTDVSHILAKEQFTSKSAMNNYILRTSVNTVQCGQINS